jgi:hypothetical protein
VSSSESWRPGYTGQNRTQDVTMTDDNEHETSSELLKREVKSIARIHARRTKRPEAIWVDYVSATEPPSPPWRLRRWVYPMRWAASRRRSLPTRPAVREPHNDRVAERPQAAKRKLVLLSVQLGAKV